MHTDELSCEKISLIPDDSESELSMCSLNMLPLEQFCGAWHLTGSS